MTIEFKILGITDSRVEVAFSSGETTFPPMEFTVPLSADGKSLAGPALDEFILQKAADLQLVKTDTETVLSGTQVLLTSVEDSVEVKP